MAANLGVRQLSLLDPAAHFLSSTRYVLEDLLTVLLSRVNFAGTQGINFESFGHVAALLLVYADDVYMLCRSASASVRAPCVRSGFVSGGFEAAC